MSRLIVGDGGEGMGRRKAGELEVETWSGGWMRFYKAFGTLRWRFVCCWEGRREEEEE